MKTLKALGMCLISTPAIASQHNEWMCLHENVSIAIIHPESIPTGEIDIEIKSTLSFPIGELAVDFQFASSSAEARLEQSIVIAFDRPLNSGETRTLTARLDISDDHAQKFAQSHEILASASLANVLDVHQGRLIIREKLGPAYEVFWPKQPQSKLACDIGL